MAGVPIRNVRGRAGISATASGRLEAIFQDKWPEVDILIKDFADSQRVPLETLYIILLSEVKPVDWRKWPKTWHSSKRVGTLLNTLKPMYWEAFRSIDQKHVLETIVEWNTWTNIPAAKMLRLIGKAVSVKKAYWLGKGLKDYWVVSYYVYTKGLSLDQQFSQAIKLLKDVKALEPYLWHWVKPEQAIPAKETKYNTIEITG